MPNVIDITDPADPRLDVYRDQKDAWLRAAHNPAASVDATQPAGLFMAEGELVIHHLVRSPYRPASVFCTPVRFDAMRDDLDRLPGGTPIYRTSREVMGEVCGFNIHRGVLAAAERSTTWSLDELSARCLTLVVLEDLSNHDNVGSIIRSAAALAGLHDAANPEPNGAGIVLSPRCCDPLYRKAVRVSMGLALRTPFVHLRDWPAPLDALRDQGWTALALTGAGDRALSDTPPPDRLALLLGAEGPGLTEQTMSLADARVRIPMHEGVDSLNVAVAGAIALDRLVPADPARSGLVRPA